MESVTPRFLVAGQLTRDYILLPSGEGLLDIPGGNVLFAAVGLALWEPEPPPAILARVGEDYPHEWLDEFKRRGLNTLGVKILPDAIDLRNFVAFQDPNTQWNDDPVAHFARFGLAFPKALLGYRPLHKSIDSRTNFSQTSMRQSDIPEIFMDTGVAHFCPSDYLTHSLIPALFRQAQFSTITLDPSIGYMSPVFWDNIPSLITGLTTFLPSEQEMFSLFQSRSSDLWEMADALSAYGCEIIVIKCGERGQMLYDAASRTRWEIPAYPARVVNTIGAGDAFCGGFLAGYRRTYDPLQAVLYGNISASLAIEGNSAFYALDVLPGLPQARLETLRHTVRRI